jgi:hypothetical protein
MMGYIILKLILGVVLLFGRSYTWNRFATAVIILRWVANYWYCTEFSIL